MFSTLEYTGERAVPWSPAVGMPVMSAHVTRYAWAMQFVYGRSVVDLGCGAGYGSYLMSWGAREVHGLDVGIEAIAFARATFQAGNLAYEPMDLEAVDHLPAAQVYVAFEVLEHLEQPLALIERVRGTLLWSVPVNDGSRFHRHVYDLAAARQLVPGSILWYQSFGVIAPAGNAWFEPMHVLGMVRL